jgi:hypothetical protein
MSIISRFAVLLGFLTILAVPATAGDEYYPRQYYGGWHKAANHNYHYRAYYYKPKPHYQGYKHHYVLYPPKSKYYYYYNPYTKKVWGRCPVSGGEEYTYSKLPPEKQAASISQVPEDAFPKLAAFPNIPEAADDAQMDAPPDDLPQDDLPND